MFLFTENSLHVKILLFISMFGFLPNHTVGDLTTSKLQQHSTSYTTGDSLASITGETRRELVVVEPVFNCMAPQITSKKQTEDPCKLHDKGLVKEKSAKVSGGCTDMFHAPRELRRNLSKIRMKHQQEIRDALAPERANQKKVKAHLAGRDSLQEAQQKSKSLQDEAQLYGGEGDASHRDFSEKRWLQYQMPNSLGIGPSSIDNYLFFYGLASQNGTIGPAVSGVSNSREPLPPLFKRKPSGPAILVPYSSAPYYSVGIVDPNY